MEFRDKRLYSVADYEAMATLKMKTQDRGYYNSAADDEHTLKSSRRAYDSIKLKQRTLVDDTKWQGLETTMLGTKIPSPLCLAPAAFQKLAHPEGELAVARAAQAAGHTPLFLSSFASTKLEDVSKECPDSVKMY